jgi:hypothetical protein
MYGMKKPWVAIACGLAVFGLLAGLALGLPVLTVVRLAFESFRPQSISWDAKNAWTKCDGAIAGTVAWPGDPSLACAAIQMCANEANLNDEQRASLASAARRLPGCDAP